MKLCPGQISWNYDRAEIIADGVIHAAGIVLGLVGAIAITIVALNVPQIETASIVVYAVSLITTLVLSATDNMWPISPTKWLLRRFDHSAIYLLIAGTYTTFLALMKSGIASVTLGIGVWCTAVIGMVLKLTLPGRFDRFAVVLCLNPASQPNVTNYPPARAPDPGDIRSECRAASSRNAPGDFVGIRTQGLPSSSIWAKTRGDGEQLPVRTGALSMKSDDVLLEQQRPAHRHSSWLAHDAVADILLAVSPTIRGHSPVAFDAPGRFCGRWKSKIDFSREGRSGTRTIRIRSSAASAGSSKSSKKLPDTRSFDRLVQPQAKG
jgi:hypothetical protein